MVQIGDFVTYGGRVCRLVGVTPMSVRPFVVQLEDLSTNEVFSVEGEREQIAAGVVAGVARAAEAAEGAPETG